MSTAAHPAREIADEAFAVRVPAAGGAVKTAPVPSRGSTIPHVRALRALSATRRGVGEVHWD